MALADGRFIKECQQLGLKTLGEGFIDRAYLADGKLQPRTATGAVFTDINKIVKQAVELATGQGVVAVNGVRIYPQVESLCLHGDNPNALEVIERSRTVFWAHQLDISAS